MNIRLSRRTRFLAVLVVLAIAWSLLGGFGPLGERQGPIDRTARSEIAHDSYSRNIETVHYNADGNLDYTVQAQEQRHFLDDTYWLARPVIEVFRDQGLRWHITAESGRIPGGEPISSVTLISDVHIRHHGSGDSQVVLHTDRLDVDPQQRTMETQSAVSLQGPGFTQTAVGMQANLEQEKVTFLSRINGRYYADDSE